jgi:hypothetical protein
VDAVQVSGAGFFFAQSTAKVGNLLFKEKIKPNLYLALWGCPTPTPLTEAPHLPEGSALHQSQGQPTGVAGEAIRGQAQGCHFPGAKWPFSPSLVSLLPSASHRRANTARLHGAAEVGYFFLITNKKISSEATSRIFSFSYSTINSGPGVKSNKEKDLNNLFPLSLFASPKPTQEKGSFLNNKTYAYLNTVSPKILRGKLNAEAEILRERIPGKKQQITPAVQSKPQPSAGALLPALELPPTTECAQGASPLSAEVVASSSALPLQGLENQPSNLTENHLEPFIGSGFESLI